MEGACGLGNLLYYNTPEALFEKLPTTNSNDNLVMTAGARIDNRDELFRIFDVPLGQRLTMPDSALMLLAYEKWGEACADHLVGDWSMAIWDKREQKLFLARDHHGITALYYYKGNDFFVFSSSLKGILCLPQVPKKVNEYKIAQLLVNWNEGGPATCYLDIMRLPPAHTLTLCPRNAHTSSTPTLNRYWYLEHTPEVHLKNDQEYADMFLDLYTEAVRCRLRSHRPVGATLSSGLDSGSVCILAAKELAKQGKRLQAYTAVPLYDVPAPPNRIGNEGPLAMALAEKLGNVDVTLCRAEGISPLDGVIKMLRILNVPEFAPGNAYWIIDFINQAYNKGIGAMLIAQYGNSSVSWPPNALYVNEKIYTQKFQLLRQLFIFSSGLWLSNVYLNKELILKYNLKGIIKSSKLSIYRLSKREQRISMIKPAKNSTLSLWAEIGLFFKIEIRDPTIDQRLIKFLLGIPHNNDNCNNRKLFEMAFKNYFVNEILSSRIRGIQSVDLDKRLNEIKIYRLLANNYPLLDDYISFNKFSKLLGKKNKRNVSIELLKIYLFNDFLQID
jgi:asparagine synthase (glutamine-hydrolysing)